MGRATRGYRGYRKSTPNVRPVRKVELSEKHTKGRLAAVMILLVIAAGAFAYALHGLLQSDGGWTEIEASSSADTNCSEDFLFEYQIGASGTDATAEQKALTLLYTDAAVTAYELFCNDATFEGVTNVRSINDHPNEELVVDDALYAALGRFVSSGRRELYLAPVYSDYDNLFYCNDDSETVWYDGAQNEEVRAYYEAVCAYAADSASVEIKLLGDGKVKLSVSEEYLAFAEENGITDFIDFYWTKNAFIADYFADVLTENGYTLGTISSCDGFIRSLDDSGTSYSYNIYDRQGDVIYPAARLDYGGARSIVFLHNYQTSEHERYRYYTMSDGSILTQYLDAADGLCRSAANNMVFYSESLGCAETLLAAIPVYIAEDVDADAVSALADGGIETIYCADSVIYYTEDGATFGDVYDGDGAAYEIKLLP